MTKIDIRLYELSEVVDKKFSHGEIHSENMFEEIASIT